MRGNPLLAALVLAAGCASVPKRTGAAEPPARFRALYSELDARFLQLMNTVGRKKGISVIAPYFPQYFYIARKPDPAFIPDWPVGLAEEWRLAVEAIGARAFSPTGRAFRDLTGGCKK